MKDIASMCGVTLKTAYDVKQRISAGESIEHRGGAGPKRCLNRGDRISLSLNIKNNPRISLRTMQSSLKVSRGVDVSYSTVRRCIKEMSYSKKTAIKGPNITPSHEALRVLWAKKHKFINWNKIFFTDECSIWLCGGRVQMWTKGTQKPVINIPRHSPKIHIWGGISTRGTTPVHIFRENFNSIAYCNVINECLTETADLLYPDGWKLQEDNSSIHKSKLSVSYKEERAIRCIDWPSCSPDLNPIENLWAVLKKRILNRAPKTIEDVKNYVDIEWGTFDPEFIGNFTKSMRKRCL